MRFHPAFALLLLAAPGVPAEEARSVHRVGRLRVAVQSVRVERRRDDAPRRMIVTMRASARGERVRPSVPVKRAALIDVRDRRFEAVATEAPRKLGPGETSFAFELPEHAAVVALEIDGRRFDVNHVVELQDGPLVP